MCIFNIQFLTSKPQDRHRNRHRNQSLNGTGTGTNHRDQKLPGPGPIIGSRKDRDRDWSRSQSRDGDVSWPVPATWAQLIRFGPKNGNKSNALTDQNSEHLNFFYILKKIDLTHLFNSGLLTM